MKILELLCLYLSDLSENYQIYTVLKKILKRYFERNLIIIIINYSIIVHYYYYYQNDHHHNHYNFHFLLAI